MWRGWRMAPRLQVQRGLAQRGLGSRASSRSFVVASQAVRAQQKGKLALHQGCAWRGAGSQLAAALDLNDGQSALAGRSWLSTSTTSEADQNEQQQEQQQAEQPQEEETKAGDAELGSMDVSVDIDDAELAATSAVEEPAPEEPKMGPREQKYLRIVHKYISKENVDLLMGEKTFTAGDLFFELAQALSQRDFRNPQSEFSQRVMPSEVAFALVELIHKCSKDSKTDIADMAFVLGARPSVVTFQRMFEQHPHGFSHVLNLLRRLDQAKGNAHPNDAEYFDKTANVIRRAITPHMGSSFVNMWRISLNANPSTINHVCMKDAVLHYSNDEEERAKQLEQRFGGFKRCLGLFHSADSKSGEGFPLAFLHIGFRPDFPSSLAEIDESDVEPNDAKVAVFYSINTSDDCFMGLGVAPQLMRRAIPWVKGHFGNIETFTTLSPIPGFSTWLAQHSDKVAHIVEEGLTDEMTDALNQLPGADPESAQSAAERFVPTLCHDESQSLKVEQVEPFKPLLLKLMEYYLVKAPQELRKPVRLQKGRQGRSNNSGGGNARHKLRFKTFNSVSHFHLQNGAQVAQINWMGDPSERAMKNAFGMMVCYQYDKDTLADNIHNYHNRGVIALAPRFSNES